MNRKSMYQALADCALQFPDYTSLDYYGTQITYRQLISEIKTKAANFQRYGIGAGTKVIICLPNIPQAVISIYALNYLGAIPCLLHPLSTAQELEYYLDLTGSQFLVTFDLNYSQYQSVIQSRIQGKAIIASGAEDLPLPLKVLYYLRLGRKVPPIKINETVCLWKSNEYHPLLPQPYQFSEAEPALILFSGGTTGKPKGVLMSNSNINSLAKQVLEQIDPKPGTDSMLCILPLFHGFGLGVCLHPVLAGGGRCILVARYNSTEFANLIRKTKPTYIAGVPTFYQAFIKDSKLQSVKLDFLKAAFCGGDTSPPQLASSFNHFIQTRGGTARLREGYGLTESVTACTVMPHGDSKAGSVGKPFTGTHIKTVKPGTSEGTAPGEDGEICITGPTIMLGYLNNVQETANVLKQHPDGKVWLHTGDLGCIDIQGYLYFRQRLKRVIKRSGYSVYPSQVEEALNSHPMVHSSCVIGIPDQYSMEKVKAFVVYKGQVNPHKTAQDLREYLSDKLIKWAIPSEIEFLSQLPLTKLGKICHTELESLERRTNPKVSP